MTFDVISTMPWLFSALFESGVVGRAVQEGKIKVRVINPRDFAEGSYKQVDDYAYGGGGMVMMAEPLSRALISLREGGRRPFTVYLSPQGVPLTQEFARSLAGMEEIALICGRYEGVDQRFVERHVDVELSIGDYVLSGGELAAAVVIDVVSRLVPGVVGSSKSVEEDSFGDGMLDWPSYTRPREWEGLAVPEVLLSGDHGKVASFRREQAVEATIRKRPDLLSRANVAPYLEKGFYVALVHHPVYNRRGEVSTTAITGLDLHDIARACRTFGVRQFAVVNPMRSQHDMVERLLSHWIEGYGADFNPKRGEALRLVKVFRSFEELRGWIERKEGAPPFAVATTARRVEGAWHWLTLKAHVLGLKRPVLFVFGTGWGLTEEFMRGLDAIMEPIVGGFYDYNHLSVRSAVAIVLDRFLGSR